MHLGFISFPGHGHVNPTLPLVEELVRRGHRVTYAVADQFAGVVEQAGAAVVHLPGGQLAAQRGFGTNGFAVLGQAMTDLVDGFDDVVAAWSADPIDALCFDTMAATGPLIAEQLGVPAISLSPSYASCEDYSVRELMFELAAQRGQSPDSAFGEQLARVGQVLKDFAAERGLTPRELFQPRPEGLNIVNIPRSFQPGADHFDERFAFVGPDLRGRARQEWVPAQPGRPLVYISLGTAFNDQPEFFADALTAFADTEWYVVMSIGRAVRLEELGPIPANVEVRDFFPQLDVLESASVFVTHAGMNSTMEALSLAVPMVAVPQMPEQLLNAQQLEKLHLGTMLDSQSVSPDSLRRAVDEVASDATIRQSVEAFQAGLRPGASTGADTIEAFLAPR